MEDKCSVILIGFHDVHDAGVDLMPVYSQSPVWKGTEIWYLCNAQEII